LEGGIGGLMSPYRILLADDHALVREGLKSIIKRDPGLTIIGEVSDGLEILAFLKTAEPDLIILDISMPHLDGVEALKEIKIRYPNVKILILTMHKSRVYLILAVSAGADGYLLKDDAFDDLFFAIEKIRQGSHYISSRMSNQVVTSLRRGSSRESSPDPNLSLKEESVLNLIAQGKSGEQIAERLSIALPTVYYYCRKLRKRFDVSTNEGLISHVLSKGYVSME
jgi:DNA-binding NarL/FixJ family response regulator